MCGSLSQLYGSSGGHFRSFIPKFRQSAFARFRAHFRTTFSRGEHASSRHISAEYAFQKPRFGDMMVWCPLSKRIGYNMCTHMQWTPFQLKCYIRTVMVHPRHDP